MKKNYKNKVVYLMILAVVITMFNAFDYTVYSKDMSSKAKIHYFNHLNKNGGIEISEDYGDVYTQGLVHAELIDFDNDGSEELFYMYIAEDNQYAYEVWGFDGEKTYKISEFKDDMFYGLREQRDMSLLKIDGKSYIYDMEHSYGRGDFLDVSTLYTVVGKMWVKSEELTGIGDQEGQVTYSLTKNGEEQQISEATYHKNLNRYEASKVKELSSGGAEGSDTFELKVNMADNNKVLFDFISMLKDEKRNEIFERNGLGNIYPSQTEEEKGRLLEFMNKFRSENLWNIYDPFNEKNTSSIEINDLVAFLYLSNNNKVSDLSKEIKGSEGEYFLVPLEQLDKYAEEVFTFKVNIRDENIKDDEFYMMSNYGNMDEYDELHDNKYEIKSMYPLGNDVYYTDFNIYVVSPEGSSYINSGYAIIKKVKDEKNYKLMNFVPMSGDVINESELKSYITEEKPNNTLQSREKQQDKEEGNLLYMGAGLIAVGIIGFLIYRKVKK